MASNRWLGRAQAIAQVDTVTSTGSPVTNDTITLTINQKSLVITIGESNPNTTTVALAIKEAWENETFTDPLNSKTPAGGGDDIAEHAEITATASGAVVTLTRDTPGEPFTLTVTESGSGTAPEATATVATGPNFYDNVDNWSLGEIPVVAADETGDDVFFDDSAVSVLHGLDQSHASNHVPSITVGRNYTGEFGLPKQNAGGYVEYRGDYLQLSATTVTVGRGDGSGSSQLKLDTGVQQTAITVESTGSPPSGLEAFLWKGTHANNTIENHDGTVGVAVFGGEVATIVILRNTVGDVRCSADTTLTTVTNESGNVELHSNIQGTLTNASGTILVGGSAMADTLALEGGTINWQSSGTITTANIGGFNRGALLDFSGDNSPRTITNAVSLRLNGRIFDPLQTVTYSAGIVPGAGVETVSAA